MNFIGRNVEAAVTSKLGQSNDTRQLDSIERRSSPTTKRRSFSIESILGSRTNSDDGSGTRDASADVDDSSARQRGVALARSSMPSWTPATSVPDSVAMTYSDGLVGNWSENDCDDGKTPIQNRVLSMLNVRAGSAYYPLDVTQTNYVTTLSSSLPPSAMLFQKCRLRRHRSDRKPRQPFTDDQLETLETAFGRQPYLSISERSDVAASLGIDEQRVKIWFQNRRAKCRRITEARVDERNRTRLIVAAAAAVAASGVGDKSAALFPAVENGWRLRVGTDVVGLDDESSAVKLMRDNVFEEGHQMSSVSRLFGVVGLDRRLSDSIGLYRQYFDFNR